MYNKDLDKKTASELLKIFRAIRAPVTTLYLSRNNLSKYTVSELVAIFKANAKLAIQAARSELEQHRGWKEIFTNILLCLALVGIGYLAYCVYNKGFFKVNTDSISKLNNLDDSIDLVPCSRRSPTAIKLSE